MDIAWQIKLIDDMIKENREATIQDYLEAVKEISGVETAFGRQMAIERILEDGKEDFDGIDNTDLLHINAWQLTPIKWEKL